LRAINDVNPPFFANAGVDTPTSMQDVCERYPIPHS